MLSKDRWLLPEGVEEVLPQKAMAVEQLRRKLLDLYHSWGYDLVEPPLIDFLDSLLTGTGHDLELMTFTLTDQHSGRQLGIRADITPQVARIDAHQLKSTTPNRLCYIGDVLKTRLQGFNDTRIPMQAGVELYGHNGIESDAEVIRLMVETLAACGIQQPHIDLGHVGIYRALVKQAGLNAEQENDLFDALQRKAVVDIDELFAAWEMDASVAEQFHTLIELNGDSSVLATARAKLQGDDVAAALDNLEAIANEVTRQLPELPLYFDLAELRGYTYHTGVVFAAFLPGQGSDIAHGGRYDGIGAAFGEARPATGFSTDITMLVNVTNTEANATQAVAIYAPAETDAGLDKAIAELRLEGERVIRALPGQVEDMAALGCDRQLVNQNGQWQVVAV